MKCSIILKAFVQSNRIKKKPSKERLEKDNTKYLLIEKTKMSPIYDLGLNDRKNIAVQLSKDLELSTVEIPIPQILPHEVLVHVKCTGICGTDVHLWKEGGIGDTFIDEDTIIGHEASGQVLAVGKDVEKDLKVGDKVAIEPQLPCQKCYFCVGGDYNLCQNGKYIGTPPHGNGTMRRFNAMDPRCLFKIPDTMTYEQGAMAEILSVGYHGIEKAGGIDLGSPVYISGAGPIGLASLVLADAAGAYPIILGDVVPEKLEFAKSLAPHIGTYKIDTSLSNEENAKAIRALFGKAEEEMPGVVLECTGFESAINTSAYVARRNGCLTILGVSASNDINNFPFMHLSFGEVDVKFINRYHQSWKPVIDLLRSGKINVDKFVSHKFDLSEAVKGFETIVDKNTPSLKVMIVDEINLI